jgi:hypothetical protein
MMPNARHVPGSSRSCGPASPLGPPLPGLCQPFSKNAYNDAYKMRQNFKMQILIYLPSTTYNFNPLKCTHFRLPLNPNLNLDRAASGFPTGHTSVDCCSFSRGEKVRMRDKPEPSGAIRLIWQQPLKYCTKRDKMRRTSHFTKADRAVPTTYNDTASNRPILSGSGAQSSATPFQSAITNYESKIEMTHFERKKGWGVRHFSDGFSWLRSISGKTPEIPGIVFGLLEGARHSLLDFRRTPIVL